MITPTKEHRRGAKPRETAMAQSDVDEGDEYVCNSGNELRWWSTPELRPPGLFANLGIETAPIPSTAMEGMGECMSLGSISKSLELPSP